MHKFEEVLELPQEAKAIDLFERVMGNHPQKKEFLENTRFAVNLEFCSKEQILKEGDEVAFIPPISGG